MYCSHDPHLNTPFQYYTHIITHETHKEKQRITYELFAGVKLGSLRRKEEYTRGNLIFAGVGLGSLPCGFLC